MDKRRLKIAQQAQATIAMKEAQIARLRAMKKNNEYLTPGEAAELQDAHLNELATGFVWMTPEDAGFVASTKTGGWPIKPEDTDVQVSFLDILEHLPCLASDHRYNPQKQHRFILITHATLHRQQRYRNGEQYVAFHAIDEQRGKIPFERIPNWRGSLGHTWTSVPKDVAFAWGLTHGHQHDVIENEYGLALVKSQPRPTELPSELYR